MNRLGNHSSIKTINDRMGRVEKVFPSLDTRYMATRKAANWLHGYCFHTDEKNRIERNQTTSYFVTIMKSTAHWPQLAQGQQPKLGLWSSGHSDSDEKRNFSFEQIHQRELQSQSSECSFLYESEVSNLVFWIGNTRTSKQRNGTGSQWERSINGFRFE